MGESISAFAKAFAPFGGAAASGLQHLATARELSAAAEEARFVERSAREEAEFARVAGGLEEMRIRRRNRRALATNRLRMAKSGIRADVGSPLLFHAQNAAELERDALNARLRSSLIRREALSRASTARDRRSNLERQGRLNRASAVLGATTGLARGFAGVK